MTGNRNRISPTIVAAAGWVVPGAGYWLIGERGRALTTGVTIVALFVLGVFVSGIRVIEVPGYDDTGAQVRVDHAGHKIDRRSGAYEGGRWALVSGALVSEVANKPWFIPQIVAGPITLAGATLSVSAARQGASRVHARLMDIGTLYTAIAGMLNLLAMIDAAYRATHASD